MKNLMNNVINLAKMKQKMQLKATITKNKMPKIISNRSYTATMHGKPLYFRLCI